MGNQDESAYSGVPLPEEIEDRTMIEPGAARPSNSTQAEIIRLRKALASAQAALNPPPGPSTRYHREDYPADEWFNIAVRLSDLYHGETTRRIYWHADAMEVREENAQLAAKVKELEAKKAALENRLSDQRRAIDEIVSLANEWSANRVGTVNLQRRRWEHMGEIARKTQEGTDHA